MSCSDPQNGFARSWWERVIGGIEVQPNAWPWIANLLFQTEEQIGEGGTSICGGTIIHSDWVLSRV